MVDNQSSGLSANLEGPLQRGDIEFVHADLLDQGVVDAAVKGFDVVFHNAADHGGRGYIDLHQGASWPWNRAHLGNLGS